MNEMKIVFIIMVLGWIGFTGQTIIACYWWFRAIRAEKLSTIKWRQYLYRIDEDGMLLRQDRADPTKMWYALWRVL